MEVKYQFSISAVRVDGDNKKVLRNRVAIGVEEATSIFQSWLLENQAQSDVMLKIRTVQASTITEKKNIPPVPVAVDDPHRYIRRLILETWEKLPEKHRHYNYLVRRLQHVWTHYVTWEDFYAIYKEVERDYLKEEEEEKNK